MKPRIYLDNAATSWPKPAAVYDAADEYMRECGAPSSRSGYEEAVQSDRIIGQARLGIANLIGGDSPENVIFTASGTDSLNMAIQGVLRPGDHVVTTVCDHNSVLRPLRAMSDVGEISVSYVKCNQFGHVSPDDIRMAIQPNTRLVAVVHGSNVTGALQPIGEIGPIVRQGGAFFLVDAAQTLGHVPIDVQQQQIDLLAAPGHKGLLGPLGTGVLYIRPGIEEDVRPYRLGGTGSISESDRQPDTLPDKYEPGNHNLPGLAGLVGALEFISAQGIEAIQSHHDQLTAQLLNGLKDVPGVTVHGPQDTTDRTSVVSLLLAGYQPQELAAVLDASGRVQCRAGLHCAPYMHEALGTLETGGTVRFSPGLFNTSEEIAQTVELISEVAAVAH